jgi:ribosomal protein S18 acetylase RimI-like enzyme
MRAMPTEDLAHRPVAPGSAAVLRSPLPAELDLVHRLMRRIEEHDRIPIATPRQELEEWLDEPHFDLTQDARLVEDGGAIVGWGRIWHQPSDARLERAYLFGGVDPAHRNRGLGSALLRWQLERGAVKMQNAASGLPRYLRTHAYDFQESATRLYARHGMAIVRYGDEMLRDLADLPPAPSIPGIAIVPWESSHSEGARVALNDAFADHWGSTPRSQESWAHVLASSGSRLDLSFMALDGDAVVGASCNAHFPDDEAVTGRRDGWIMQVGVVRSHRKRGIASALILASHAAFQAAGLTHAALGVDSENPTGAYQLYERLGYRRVRRAVTYEMEV